VPNGVSYGEYLQGCVFMNNEIKVLLGATKNDTLVFANVNLPNGNHDYFSVSFDEVRPVVASDEYLKMCAESIIESYDNNDKYILCESFDCRPCELLDEYLQSQLTCYGVEGLMDISLYPEFFRIDGIDNDIYFESVGCGQNDIRERLIPINEITSDWLHFNWDKYHLKAIDDEKAKIFKGILDKYANEVGNEEEWIKNWLETVWVNQQ
jgi:hypothetical protein